MKKSISIMTVAFILVLNIACHSSEKVSLITQEELVARLLDHSVPALIDIRTRKEYDGGHIPGAINLPITQLEKEIESLNLKVSDEIVIYCESGGRSSKAAKILLAKGYYELRHLNGDMKQWRLAKLPCDAC